MFIKNLSSIRKNLDGLQPLQVIFFLSQHFRNIQGAQKKGRKIKQQQKF